MSAAGGNGHRSGASLYDFRDLDLMHRMVDEADDQGWIETEHLARSLGLGDDHNRNVAIRMAWMRRYGMLERDDKRGLWRLSRGGMRVVQARVRAAAAKELESLPEEALIETMASVVTRYRFVDAMTATMLRREFLFGTQRR
jgi:hypothetical protein